jgi:hypothetical protein
MSRCFLALLISLQHHLKLVDRSAVHRPNHFLERNHQVQFLSAIYEGAIQVITWWILRQQAAGCHRLHKTQYAGLMVKPREVLSLDTLKQPYTGLASESCKRFSWRATSLSSATQRTFTSTSSINETTGFEKMGSYLNACAKTCEIHDASVWSST